MEYPARLVMDPKTPITTKRTAMPAPGPVPTSHPKTGTRLPPDIMAGSNIQSARGPVMAMEMGEATLAIRDLVAKTRPCIAGGTLDCQMAWLEPLRMGRRPWPHSKDVRPTSRWFSWT